MSLSQTLVKAVNDAIHTFITLIADQYNLDENELISLWDENEVVSKSVKNKSKSLQQSDENVDDVDHSLLAKCSKNELVALCKAKNMKCTGTKAVLIGYLTGTEVDADKSTEEKKNKSAGKTTTVVKKLLASAPNIPPIRRNGFGNYEHPETTFIFNTKNKMVIGKQNEDGTISDLTAEDINLCNKFKFSFQLPENLDKKSSLANVQVEDLDELEFSDEEDIELEEELLEDDFEDDDLEDDDEFEEEYEDDE